MIAETTAFFREVLTRDAGLREFLDSDWTMLNERLATHYGIAGVTGEAMRRVRLAPENHRGGLLTQASILSLTSDGTRHRPVHRGVWVLESIVGKPPPPPPANVPALGTPAADHAQDDRAGETRTAPRRHELRRLPPANRPARPGVRQLRRHRPLASRRDRARRDRSRPGTRPERRTARRQEVRRRCRAEAAAARRQRPLRGRLRREARDLRPPSPR